MKLSLPLSPPSSGHSLALHVVKTQPYRLTWHHGSRFSETSPKIRMRCTTTSESMDLVSCWSWVSDDDDDKLFSIHKYFLPSMTFITCFLWTTAKPVGRSLPFQCSTPLFDNSQKTSTKYDDRLYCLRRRKVCQQICNSCITLRHLLHYRRLHWHIYQLPWEWSLKVSCFAISCTPRAAGALRYK